MYVESRCWHLIERVKQLAEASGISVRGNIKRQQIALVYAWLALLARFGSRAIVLCSQCLFAFSFHGFKWALAGVTTGYLVAID